MRVPRFGHPSACSDCDSDAVAVPPQAEVPKDQVKDYSKYVAKKDEMWLGKIESKAAVGLQAGSMRTDCIQFKPHHDCPPDFRSRSPISQPQQRIVFNCVTVIFVAMNACCAGRQVCVGGGIPEGHRRHCRSCAILQHARPASESRSALPFPPVASIHGLSRLRNIRKDHKTRHLAICPAASLAMQCCSCVIRQTVPTPGAGLDAIMR